MECAQIWGSNFHRVLNTRNYFKSLHRSYVKKSMSKSESQFLEWFETKAPRLLKMDPRTLSLDQLLSLILDEHEMEHSSLISDLMKVCNGDIRVLNNVPIENFKELGLSFEKADRLLAALELVNRGLGSEESKDMICSSSDAFRLIRSRLSGLKHEEFWIMIMNRANHLIGLHRVSSGGVSGTVVDSKLVFLKLLQFSASSVIFAHNHPSGNLKPSQADIKLTEKLRKAGDFLDIVVLDHLILSDEHYFSFADEGLIVPK